MTECICGHHKKYHKEFGCCVVSGCTCYKWRKPTALKELLKQIGK